MINTPETETNIQDVAWGTALQPPTINYVSVGQPIPLENVTLTYTTMKPEAVNQAIAKLNAMCRKIESDIAYFGLYKGQAMAQNKLGMIKFDLKEIIAQLEK